jgi:hypothetical protein
MDIAALHFRRLPSTPCIGSTSSSRDVRRLPERARGSDLLSPMKGRVMALSVTQFLSLLFAACTSGKVGISSALLLFAVVLGIRLDRLRESPGRSCPDRVGLRHRPDEA